MPPPLPCPVAVGPRQGRLPQVSNGSAGITVDSCDFKNSPRPRQTRVQNGSDPGSASSHPPSCLGAGTPRFRAWVFPLGSISRPGPPLPVVSLGCPSRAGPAPLCVSGNGHLGMPWGARLLSPPSMWFQGAGCPLATRLDSEATMGVPGPSYTRCRPCVTPFCEPNGFLLLNLSSVPCDQCSLIRGLPGDSAGRRSCPGPAAGSPERPNPVPYFIILLLTWPLGLSSVQWSVPPSCCASVPPPAAQKGTTAP